MKCSVCECIHPLIRLLKLETHNFVGKCQIKWHCGLSIGVHFVSLIQDCSAEQNPANTMRENTYLLDL